MYYHLYLLLCIFPIFLRILATLAILGGSSFLIIKFANKSNAQALRFGLGSFAVLGIFYAVYDFVSSLKSIYYLHGYPMLLPEFLYTLIIAIFIFLFCKGKPLQSIIILVSTFLFGYIIACFVILIISIIRTWLIFAILLLVALIILLAIL